MYVHNYMIHVQTEQLRQRIKYFRCQAFAMLMHLGKGQLTGAIRKKATRNTTAQNILNTHPCTTTHSIGGQGQY
jgi:hypothetical protein